MHKNKRDELIFWRDVPVDVERGAFEYISEHWGNEVIFISYNGFSKERNQVQWGNNKLNEIILSDEENIDKYIGEIFSKYPNAIHIFNGFRGKTKKYLKRFAKNKNAKIGIIAERPSYFGSETRVIFKNIAILAMYRYYAFRYSDKIGVFLTMGQKGVDIYGELGFKKNLLYPFMYNPLVKKSSNNNEILNKSNLIKILYVGRFSATFKGVDVLIEAVQSIDKENWQLDFVGGYGDLKEKVIDFAMSNEHVQYKGTWKSDEVISRMSGYDICIIPSKYDGWNLIANEAINAGIGVIITNQATSDELIRASGAGIVIPANNVKALIEAMNLVIMRPELLLEFKKNARSYAPKISSQVVGDYFIDIMDHTFYQQLNERPKCPWM